VLTKLLLTSRGLTTIQATVLLLKIIVPAVIPVVLFTPQLLTSIETLLPPDARLLTLPWQFPLQLSALIMSTTLAMPPGEPTPGPTSS
jgi:hypothetical protein